MFVCVSGLGNDGLAVIERCNFTGNGDFGAPTDNFDFGAAMAISLVNFINQRATLPRNEVKDWYISMKHSYIYIGQS